MCLLSSGDRSFSPEGALRHAPHEKVWQPCGLGSGLPCFMSRHGGQCTTLRHCALTAAWAVALRTSAAFAELVASRVPIHLEGRRKGVLTFLCGDAFQKWINALLVHAPAESDRAVPAHRSHTFPDALSLGTHPA